jgi:predicted HicB family RNase H-like nuclease
METILGAKGDTPSRWRVSGRALGLFNASEIGMTMPPSRDADETVSLQLRIPERLRQDLAAAARANGRSLNSELVQRLTNSFTSLLDLDLTTAERERERAEHERERAEYEQARAQLEKQLTQLLRQRVEVERDVRASWDAERERERAERTRLVDMLERQARTEAQVEVLSNQLQDFKKHQENIEFIPMILSAVEQLGDGLDALGSLAVDADGGTIGGVGHSELSILMKKKRRDAYVASLPPITAEQVKEIKELLKETDISEEKFLERMEKSRIEDIREFARAKNTLLMRRQYLEDGGLRQDA